MPALARNVAEAERAARLKADPDQKQTDAAGAVTVERWRARLLTDVREADVLTHAMVVHATHTYVEVKAAECAFLLGIRCGLRGSCACVDLIIGFDSKRSHHEHFPGSPYLQTIPKKLTYWTPPPRGKRESTQLH
jgi:hypothetical protein